VKSTRYVAKNLLGYRQTTDAYLMVLAKERDLMLVTFDRKIERYCPFESVVQVLPA
jgi:predicted nucleic acid-binding protein